MSRINGLRLRNADAYVDAQITELKKRYHEYLRSRGIPQDE